MIYILEQLRREWRFMIRQRYILVLLFCSLLVSGFSVLTGISEVNNQRQTIERLAHADEIDRAEAQAKHNDPGSLAYYSFHLTYAAPSNLAFAALGERDNYPWKHRVRMLALEGQIYESDTQNPELAQAGKIDFVFVISVLAPLFIILLFHDLIVSERNSGRHDLLITTAKSPYVLWGSRIVVRFFAVLICLMAPFYMGAVLSNTSLSDVFLVTVLCVAYLLFWTILSVWLGKNTHSAPRTASILIGSWLLFAFVTPVLGDLTINHQVHSPKGGDILFTQREAVNDAWDLPVETTMDTFEATHPEYKGYSKVYEGFDWRWYYAFQQNGDQAAAKLSSEYRAAAFKKYQLAEYVSFLSPALLLQRKLTRIADTDILASFHYDSKIREFHKRLRHFYYPWLFIKEDFDKSQLMFMPLFEETKHASSELEDLSRPSNSGLSSP